MSTIDIKTADLFLPGRHRVEILRVFVGEDAARKSFFVVETLVLKSDNPSIGDECEWIYPLESDSAFKNIRAFVGAANGYNPKLPPNIGQLVDQAVCWINPLMSTRLDLHCYYSKQAGTGDKILVHSWSPLKTAKPGQPYRRRRDTLVSRSLRRGNYDA